MGLGASLAGFWEATPWRCKYLKKVRRVESLRATVVLRFFCQGRGQKGPQILVGDLRQAQAFPVLGAKLQKLGEVQAIVSQGVRRQLPLHPQVPQEIFQMVPAAHGDGIPGKGFPTFPFNSFKR